MLVAFGAFTFDSARCTLFQGSTRIHLTRKAFGLLGMLLQQRPAVVLKRQIMDALWPDCFISESNVASLVSEIRTALGQDGRSWLRTVHGVGYAFAGETSDDARAGSPAPESGFVLIEKSAPPRTLALADGVTVIGRGVRCDVRVASTSVSRAHAQICLQRGAATLEDLGSMNGTYLRGRRLVAPAPLLDGDEIRVGSVDLVFRTADPERATEPMS